MYNLNDSLDYLLELQRYLDGRSKSVDLAAEKYATTLLDGSEQVYKYLLRLKHEGAK